MLLSFAIKNYTSILDLDVDFRFSEGKAPNGYKDSDHLIFLESGKQRAVPCLSFFGANASGKSNILKALSVFQRIAATNITKCYRPNKLNEKYDYTQFTLKFVANNKVYEYSIEYDAKEIRCEYLIKNEKELYRISTNKQEFSVAKEENLTNIFHEACFDTYERQKFFRNTLLSRMKLISPNLDDDILRVFDYIDNLQIFPTNSFPHSYSIGLLAGEFGNLEPAFLEISSLLRKLDINILRMSLEFTPNNTNWLNSVDTYRKNIDGKETKFHISEESSGTQLLLGILGVILYVLKKGQILVIDELDRSLHPLLLKVIVRMFKSKAYNQHNAQLIFSAHDTSVLEDELLRISEVAFVQNTLTEGSTASRLCDFEEVSNYDNFRKMYMNYQFGAVPFSYI